MEQDAGSKLSAAFEDIITHEVITLAKIKMVVPGNVCVWGTTISSILCCLPEYLQFPISWNQISLKDLLDNGFGSDNLESIIVKIIYRTEFGNIQARWPRLSD